MDYKEKFKELSNNTVHGDGTYLEHCFGVYTILKNINADIDVCKAGLYHSVYGSEHFNPSINISRNDVVGLIGTISEDLVFKFCNIRDRFNIILNNSFKFNPYVDKALTQIEYANLREQYQRTQSTDLSQMCDALMQKISLFDQKYEHHIIDNKDLYIFDTLFESADIEYINQYCLNSVYKPEHSSNDMNYEQDSRFVSFISPNELHQSKLLPAIEKISSFLQKNIYLGYHYINHYTLNTSVSEHCDSSESGHYTILVFPNKYWEDGWGGEIAFYDKGNVHKLIKFVPGRVIVFDSKLAHKVLPLTRNARKDRYSIAIKCCDDSGLDTFKEIYNIHTKVNRNEF